MLDTETKRRIDAARDILVGKVPDPKSQVEQITIALIYKFMDDMDAQAEELGGTRAFFAGEFEKYSWAKLMRVGSSGYEILNLYAEAITRMTQNANLPSLFREIFKNAYLPYRDPETLKQFLKIINEFAYDHSERLGDAFEYLLAVLGSQGDAGQFRTPRHIIDFMVALLDPQKNEALLDPACGTAGFLISAYKHIWHANARDGRPGAALTPAERARLVRNIKGYDISPDMVRLSLVNLYLHGFAEPHIVEYDTLTSDDRWNEHADLIMANPPFMSPKGGIRPHKRFSVQSNRSEVLFVDYIAEHLTANGRAAVIVPEGIIFQSGKAYKALRKMLVEKYLVGVISLPAGVFNPYSGVKTSILWLDKTLAKKTDEIIFVKIEHDGFDLGAQRRENKLNDLPAALENLQGYRRALQTGENFTVDGLANLALVDKARLAENGDYNLSGERYHINEAVQTVYELVPVGRFMRDNVQTIDPRATPDEVFELWSIPAYDAGNPEIIRGEDVGSQKKRVQSGDVLLSRIIPHIRRALVIEKNHSNRKQIASTEWIVFSSEQIVGGYLRNIFLSDYFHSRFMQTLTGVGGSLQRANPRAVGEILIPLPPLAVQQEIVAEIEGYQKIIEGARQVVENYQPRIEIEPEWETVLLGDVAEFKNGLNFTKDSKGEKIKILGVSHFQDNLIAPVDEAHEIRIDSTIDKDSLLQEGDILFVRSNGNQELVGRSMVIPQVVGKISFSGFTIRARFTSDKINPLFYGYLFKSNFHREMFKNVGRGANIRNLSQSILSEIQIPLPNLATQQRIVTRIEREQALVQANRELISLFEEKIRARIARVWGEA
ncbi:restriction endonuclease subunit M/S [Anaerolineae bacterium CFX7]|nr:restriction endonuclease subunit M/S [Anaerolineae bacterium CFX7]